ncbi:FAD-dependent oxidoreductase [Halorubrum lacusprofundi]|jgi:2-polyprenyl-6-methoxyphenol hydroxylase-like FAD-dependent oxidoreductase|uniref:Monooxygenase FAD-binding n=1 Tax=Halorubrum lacusprofundi (strain ATCC 49239 / DSM 5036 / JCM 8891 / ACAM 34) TaxID=416348 RepID=B9LPP1_HALLT|nr:FAD-dependent oxidoreductase [Halorubrum lacusprofundi]ACM57329.1 monooxygenase FAD-binding [Halorubrum lacusprofundi ATCC 49239]MCG1006063.1 FAD-dependent oxidoreductase [Halorubrum lacusprofundi]
MTARTETAAVVVVGCGPGGAVLAYLLARSGIDVALVERAATFEREYRGFGWNPGVVRLFDEMDLLDDVLALAHETVTEGSFSLYGEESTVLDFDLLDTDYPYALLMEQPALLDCLVDRANSSDNFTFHPATTVTDICTNTADGIRGVTARDRDADEDVEFKTQCVVGADGRYSTVRASAGIDPGLFESPIDLVWFKLPRGAINATTQGRIDRNGVLLYFGLGGGDLQIGYLIRSGEWPSIRQAGFDAFRERVAEIDPRVGSTMAVQLDGFRDTSLLDVAPGIADSWSRDGLLLIGDAAHTASPIGAQGNPLAVEDAVVAHSLLVEKLTGTDGILERKTLHEFEVRRRAHVEQVISLQRRAATNLAYWLEYGRYVPPRLVRGMTKAARVIVPRSRSVRNTIETFALGQRSVSVDRSHFID